MAVNFVGDNDHGDAGIPLSVTLWAEITKLREEVVRLNNVIKELEHIESVRRQKMLHDIGWCFECGGAKDGSLNQLLYDLARKEVEDMVIPNNSVAKSYQNDS